MLVENKLVNCFTYQGERELLEFRLKYLYDKFNEFVISEADYTLSGNPREFSLERDLDELGIAKEKIKIVQVRQNDLPKYGKTMEERYDALFDILGKSVPANSIVFANHIDEVPNYGFIDYYTSISLGTPTHCIRLPLAHLSGHINWILQSAATGELVQNRQGYVCRSEHFRVHSVSDFRREKTRDGRWTWVDVPSLYLQDNSMIQDAGWKFQWMGNNDRKWQTYIDSHFYSEHSKLGHELRQKYMANFVPLDGCQDPVAVRGHHLRPYNTGSVPRIIYDTPHLHEYFSPTFPEGAEAHYQPFKFDFEHMPAITIGAQAKQRIWIVDDFYDDPYSVREFAMRQDFYDDPGYIGKRTRKQFFFPGLKEKFEEIMGLKITNWESHGMNGRFQHNVAGESTTWHTDFQRWAGLIYLTPDAPFQAGTRMAAYKKNRVRHCSDPRIMDCFNQITFLDGTLYEDVDIVGNVFNRLVIYDGGLIHAAMEYFGDNLDNCRLWHMFFFDA